MSPILTCTRSRKSKAFRKELNLRRGSVVSTEKITVVSTEKYIRASRALRQLAMTGECTPPRQDSISAERTSAGDLRSRTTNIFVRSDKFWQDKTSRHSGHSNLPGQNTSRTRRP